MLYCLAAKGKHEVILDAVQLFDPEWDDYHAIGNYIEADSWLAAKDALGKPLTKAQEILLENQEDIRDAT